MLREAEILAREIAQTTAHCDYERGWHGATVEPTRLMRGLRGKKHRRCYLLASILCLATGGQTRRGKWTDASVHMSAGTYGDPEWSQSASNAVAGLDLR